MLSGSGLTTTPNFSGAVSIDATNATLELGRGTGNAPLAAALWIPPTAPTLTGYNTGNISVAAGGNGLDDVAINGITANVLSVSATPVAVGTDQNHAGHLPDQRQHQLRRYLPPHHRAGTRRLDRDHRR